MNPKNESQLDDLIKLDQEIEIAERRVQHLHELRRELINRHSLNKQEKK